MTFKDQAHGRTRGKHGPQRRRESSAPPDAESELQLLTRRDRTVREGARRTTSTWTRRTDETATYHPVDTLYLVAGMSTISTQDTTKRSQNYAFNWSPFFGGALQFSFAYTESLGVRKKLKGQDLRSVPDVEDHPDHLPDRRLSGNPEHVGRRQIGFKNIQHEPEGVFLDAYNARVCNRTRHNLSSATLRQ